MRRGLAEHNYHGIIKSHLKKGQTMPTLTIVTPTRREIHATNVMSLLQAFGGMNSPDNKTGYQLSFRTLAGKSNIHHSRSIAASNWYDSAMDNDLMLFIDADHTYSVDDLKMAINKYKNTDASVVCGVYSNSAGTRPNIYPKDAKGFMEGGDDEVWYGGTGFMLIGKPILDKIRRDLEQEIGTARVWISDNEGERNVIPFFTSAFINNELDPSSSLITWLGEDYSFCYRVRKSGGVIRAFVSRTIGHDTSQIKYFYPDNYVNKVWDEDTLVYFCGPSRVTFSPKSNNLGGSEQAVVELARNFKRSGKWKDVVVYGNVNPGIYDGVRYIHVDDFDVGNKFGDIILWRGFGNTVLKNVKANRIYIDLHDNTDIRMIPPDIVNTKVEKIFVKSEFHKSLFPQLDPDKFVVIPNGVQVELFTTTKRQEKEREPYRFCWTSSYRRNLAENLEYIWPTIKRNIPEAEFHVYYGDDFLQEDLKDRLTSLLSQDGVFHHGRVSLKKIAEERKRSSFHLYVTNTLEEIDCISVRESAVSGCVPLITKYNIFSERDGFHVDVTDVTNKTLMESAALDIVNFVKDQDLVRETRNSLKEKSSLGWDSVSSEWISQFFNE